MIGMRYIEIDPRNVSTISISVRHFMPLKKEMPAVIVARCGATGEKYLANQLHELVTYLNYQGVVTILILAQHGLVSAAESPVDLSYLSDTVLSLRFFEAAGEVRQSIAVIKKRSGRHEKTIREFKLESGRGIRVGQPLKDFHGVLTGAPVFRGATGEIDVAFRWKKIIRKSASSSLRQSGGDAQGMAELLVGHGFEAQICGSLAECAAHIQSGAGALMLTEEALELGSLSHLFEALAAQPPWSELPLIILTAGGESRLARLLELAADAAGSVTLLERPVGTTTLIRSLEVALNSRRRQYQVRDFLEEQRRTERELRQAHEQLADRAKQLETLVESRTEKLAESNEKLRREMTEREALRRKLLHAQEEERRRIARELHDQMGQNLTALNVGLKSLLDRQSRSGLGSRVQRLQELATQTARDLNRVAVELRPAALDDLGLVKAIRALTETWSTRYGIDVDFEAGQYQACRHLVRD